MKFRRPADRRDALLTMGAAGLGLVTGVPWAAAAPASEKFDVLVLKTAIIGKIAEFVRWPASSGLADVNRPFEFVILGKTPLAAHCQRLYRDQRVTIAGHRVFLRIAQSLADIGRPNLLFVSPEYSEELPELLSVLGREPVLTVGDTEGFAHRGLAVNLYVAEDRVRFEISRKAFERHHLEASYRLLGLARLIENQQAMR